MPGTLLLGGLALALGIYSPVAEWHMQSKKSKTRQSLVTIMCCDHSNCCDFRDGRGCVGAAWSCLSCPGKQSSRAGAEEVPPGPAT